MPHSPPPLPFSPVSSLQQPHSKIKAVLRSIISRGLAAFSVRSFACRYSALVTSPPSPLPLLGFCVPNQRYRLRQLSAPCPPRPLAAKPRNIAHLFTTDYYKPTLRATSCPRADQENYYAPPARDLPPPHAPASRSTTTTHPNAQFAPLSPSPSTTCSSLCKHTPL